MAGPSLLTGRLCKGLRVAVGVVEFSVFSVWALSSFRRCLRLFAQVIPWGSFLGEPRRFGWGASWVRARAAVWFGISGSEVSFVAGNHADHRLWYSGPLHEVLLAGSFCRSLNVLGSTQSRKRLVLPATQHDTRRPRCSRHSCF